MRLGLGLGIVKSAASIYKGILDKFPNAVAAYSTRKLKTSYPTTLPADYGGGAAAAYSLRKVKSDYGGSAVKVRRSSDGGLQDIGFDSNGNLDTTALEDFVNADVNQYTSDFSVNDDGWAVATDGGTAAGNIDGISDGTTSKDDVLRFTVDTTTTPNHRLENTTILEGGYAYTIDFEYYIPSTNANLDSFRVQNSGGSSSFFTDTDTWSSGRFSNTNGSGGYLRFQTADGGTVNYTGNGLDVFYMKNIVVTQTTADGHVTRWYSQSDPVDTYTADFSGGVDNFVGNGDNTLTGGTPTGGLSITDEYGTTIDNVLELNCENTNDTEHPLRKNNPFGASNPINGKTLKCSFKMLVPLGQTGLVSAALSDGNLTTAGILSDGKVTEQGRWTTFTDVAWTQTALQSRLIFMGLDSSDDPEFVATAGDKFYIADVVLTETTDAYNATSTEQPLIVEGGNVVTENGKPTIKFDGVDDLLDIGQSIDLYSLASEWSVFMDAKIQDYTLQSFQRILINDSSSTTGDIPLGVQFRNTGDVYFFNNGSSDSTTVSSATQRNLVSFIKRSSDTIYAINGTSATGTKGSVDFTTGLEDTTIGNSPNGTTRPAKLKTAELIIFNSDQSTNRKDIEWNINNHYSIYDQWDRESCMNVRRSSDNVTQDIGFSGKNINQTQLESFVNDASPVLDDYTGDDAAAAAYSLRKVRSAYTGNAINVRRSSDGDTKDIGFDANGDLDTTALTTFVNEDITQYNYSTATQMVADFSSVKGAISVDTIGGEEALKFTIDTQSGTHFPYRFNVFGGGGECSISFDYYIPSTNTDIDGIQMSDGSRDIGATQTIQDAWTSVTITDTLAGEHIYIFSKKGTSKSYTGNGTDVFYIKNLVATQTTADGHVTTWYDQAGINNATADCSNPSACEQPLIVEAGDVVLENNKPAIKFDGVDDSFTANALAGLSRLDIFFTHQTSDSQYVHFAEVSSITDRGFTANNGDSGDGLPANMGTPTMYNNGTQFTGTTRDDVRTAQDGHQIISYIDADTTAFATFEIGGHGSYIFNGKFQELIAFDSDQSTNRLSIEGNIGRYYNITGYRDGFVTKWYDQSGEYNHAENSTSDEQPLVVSGGSVLTMGGASKPAIQGSTSSLALTTALTPTDFSIIHTSEGLGFVASINEYIRISDYYRYNISGNNYVSNDANAANQSIYVSNRNGTTLNLRRNGSEMSSSPHTSVTTALNITTIFNRSSLFFVGKISEFIIFESDQSSNLTDIEKNINTHFKIYS